MDNCINIIDSVGAWSGDQHDVGGIYSPSVGGCYYLGVDPDYSRTTCVVRGRRKKGNSNEKKQKLLSH
jgi:hypothetical protein